MRFQTFHCNIIFFDKFSCCFLFRNRNFRTFASPRPVQFSSLALDPSGEVICAGSHDTFEIFVWAVQTGRLLEVSNASWIDNQHLTTSTIFNAIFLAKPMLLPPFLVVVFIVVVGCEVKIQLIFHFFRQ